METTRNFLFYLRPTEWLSPGGPQIQPHTDPPGLPDIGLFHADQQGNQSIFIFQMAAVTAFFRSSVLQTGGGDDGRFAEFHPMPMKRINQWLGHDPVPRRFLRSYTNLPVLSFVWGHRLFAFMVMDVNDSKANNSNSNHHLPIAMGSKVINNSSIICSEQSPVGTKYL